MPQFWKGEARNGFRVRCSVKSNGSAAEAREADLVFINERPFVVLEWAESGAAMVTIELDPAQLRAADQSGHVFDYSGILTDPR